jgi:hypothetical protein
MTRRLARDLPIPQSEVAVLKHLTRPQLLTRVAQLFEAGWTLQSIGNALDPVRPRSTIKSWVDQQHRLDPIPTPIPQPSYKTPKEGYVRITPVSPGVPADTAERLRFLASNAKNYRARMSSATLEYKCNQELTEVVLELRANNVSIADIARAAGVTHRAISKRASK